MAPPYPNNLNTNHQFVPPTDNIQSGLAIPLHAVGSEHVGNKLRLVVQIIDMDPTGTYALVTARPATASSPSSTSSSPSSTPSSSGIHRPTLILNLTTALLGHLPSAAPPQRDAYSPSPAAISRAEGAGVTLPIPPVSSIPRSRLNLSRGEWICAVGWLEPGGYERQVCVPTGYAPPLQAVMEVISVTPVREPPTGALFGSDMPRGFRWS